MGWERTTSSRAVLGLLAVASALAAAPAGAASTVPTWPDGEWNGSFVGAGSVAGSSHKGQGAGHSQSEGYFVVNLDGGAVSGEYTYRWVGRGAGTNAQGDPGTGSLVVEETGSFALERSDVTMVREAGSAVVNVDGYGVAHSGSLASTSTPMLVTFADCNMAEGYHQQNLDGLDDALGLRSFFSTSTETFVAARSNEPLTTENRRQLELEAEAMRQINERFDLLLGAVRADVDGISVMSNVASLNELIVDADGVAFEFRWSERDCDSEASSNSAEFRRGVGSRVEEIINELLRWDLSARDLIVVTHGSLYAGLMTHTIVRPAVGAQLDRLRSNDLSEVEQLHFDMVARDWGFPVYEGGEG